MGQDLKGDRVESATAKTEVFEKADFEPGGCCPLARFVLFHCKGPNEERPFELGRT